ncbi:DUF441 domain-containing protein [Cohnella pontilimi]|uniref:UPF0756 membrane protein E5161_01475 n=1 Tax=Cohnella pontilimi TaxID=2564100 RepID=A0A4U0FGN9_9BACL|nr:DUF441 domain-containing protein [Cohnella pontilimi]TJY44097.1 DUF441 domain-containing protein [Cohnella pontilimi]
MHYLNMPMMILLLLALLGILSKNDSITVASLFLLLLKSARMEEAFPWIQKNGLNIGIIVLTIGILAPFATGAVGWQQLLQSFVHWKSIAAIGVGIGVAYLGARGVHLMTVQPAIVTGLIIGTVIGVAFLKGVPVGPLIAAGILSLMVR